MTSFWSLYGCPPGRIRRMPLHGASRSKVGMLHCQSFGLHKPQFSHLLMPFSELDLIREALSAAVHTAGEHVRKLQSSSAFRCSNVEPAYVKNESPQTTHVGESNSTPSDVRQLSRRQKRVEAWSHTSCWPCYDPMLISPSWFSAPPGLTLPVGSRPDYWRNGLLYRAGDVERHPGQKRAILFRGRDVLMQPLGHRPLTANFSVSVEPTIRKTPPDMCLRSSLLSFSSAILAASAANLYPCSISLLNCSSISSFLNLCSIPKKTSHFPLYLLMHFSLCSKPIHRARCALKLFLLFFISIPSSPCWLLSLISSRNVGSKTSSYLFF